MKAVIFGSTTGNTEAVAQKIADALGGADVMSVSDASPADLDKYEVLVFGTSTWGVGDLQDDWEDNLDILDGIDYTGKKVALFGLGDQESYADTFVDGMKALKDKISAKGGKISGEWPVDGYTFDSSASVEGDHFIGLALDEDNQADKTDERIASWVSTI